MPGPSKGRVLLFLFFPLVCTLTSLLSLCGISSKGVNYDRYMAYQKDW